MKRKRGNQDNGTPKNVEGARRPKKVKGLKDFSTRLHNLLREEIRDFEAIVSRETKQLETEKKELQDAKESFEKELQWVANSGTYDPDELVVLNVGGKTFETRLSTFRSVWAQGSMLEAMFSGRHKIQKNPRGQVFIDRDGGYFAYILNYLRTGNMYWPESASKRVALVTELDYYQIQDVSYKRDELRWVSHTDMTTFLEGKVALCSPEVGTEGMILHANKCFTTGRHEWFVQLLMVKDDSYEPAIGIMKKHAELTNFSWGDFEMNAIGIASDIYDEANDYKPGRHENDLLVSRDFVVGDIVRITVDLDRRTLDFACNGLRTLKAPLKLGDEFCKHGIVPVAFGWAFAISYKDSSRCWPS